MTTEELKKLWEPNSAIAKWSDIRAEWPNEEINLYYNLCSISLL